MTTKERLTVNIDPAQFEQLQRLAEQHAVSLAWLGRHAIARLLAAENIQAELPFPPVQANQRPRSA
ncbi:MAG: CopG family transcriptional regulator [Gammaproteobacteria bacterium]|nr:CopG family transcriptional regulator [Gammaproteobacteria bacterium]